MRYAIEISPEAQREIKRLPAYVRAQAIELIDDLADNPRPPRAKELREKANIYRIWLAGRWRIVYSIQDGVLLITVIRVRRKSEIDYDEI